MLEIDSVGNEKSLVLTELERGLYGSYAAGAMLREHTSGWDVRQAEGSSEQLGKASEAWS